MGTDRDRRYAEHCEGAIGRLYVVRLGRFFSRLFCVGEIFFSSFFHKGERCVFMREDDAFSQRGRSVFARQNSKFS